MPSRKYDRRSFTPTLPDSGGISEQPCVSGPDGAFDAALTPREAAALIGVRTKTLANWRCQGRGPRFVKFGPVKGKGAIRYRRSDLVSWLMSHTRGSGE